MSAPLRAVIHVVAGVVIDATGRVLIAQRPPGKHLAGGWEFPGGKLEPGETRAAGLARELQEEVGIRLRDPRPLMRLRHTYPYGEVLLDVWVVRRYDGEPRGLDGQAIEWRSLESLARAELLPADVPIVRNLRLPERLTSADSPYYAVRGAGARLAFAAGHAVGEGPVVGQGAIASEGPLRGELCSGVDEALAAASCAGPGLGAGPTASAGADFLVLRRAIDAVDLRDLCRSVAVPVYACDLGLEQAWSLGATGLNELELRL